MNSSVLDKTVSKLPIVISTTAIFLILLVATSFSARASDHHEKTHYDRIHLSVSSSAKIQNDTMIATLYVEEEGQQASVLSDAVNKKIRWALSTLDKHSVISHQTNAYSTNPIYNKNKIKGWRVRQSIRLESKDMALMSDVLGQLQQQLALQSMQFSVSPLSKNKQDEKLIDEAIAAFEKRAQQVTNKLRRNNFRIVDMTISTSGSRSPRPQYQMRAMAMESDMKASPAVSAGEQTVSVTVSGSVELE